MAGKEYAQKKGGTARAQRLTPDNADNGLHKPDGPIDSVLYLTQIK